MTETMETNEQPSLEDDLQPGLPQQVAIVAQSPHAPVTALQGVAIWTPQDQRVALQLLQQHKARIASESKAAEEDAVQQAVRAWYSRNWNDSIFWCISFGKSIQCILVPFVFVGVVMWLSCKCVAGFGVFLGFSLASALCCTGSYIAFRFGSRGEASPRFPENDSCQQCVEFCVIPLCYSARDPVP